MKRLFSILLLSSLALSACYGNNDIKTDNVFKCKTDDDCLVDDGYVCSNTHQCVYKDPDKPLSCDDRDGDGYGSPNTDPSAWRTCRVCLEHPNVENYCNGSLKDCAPDDNTIYPGAFDYCDGKDRDCNGHDDDGVYECKSGSDCTTNTSKFLPPSFNLTGGMAAGCYKQQKCVVFKKVGTTTNCHIYTCVSGKLTEDSANNVPCSDISQ